MGIVRWTIRALAVLLIGLGGCGSPRQDGEAVVRLVPAPLRLEQVRQLRLVQQESPLCYLIHRFYH